MDNIDYEQVWKDYRVAMRKEYDRRNPNKPIPKWVTKELLDSYDSPYRKDVYKLEFGQFFLFQIVDGHHRFMQAPVLALHQDVLPADQTVEMVYTQKIRTWQYNFKFKEHNFLYPNVELEGHVEWGDSMYVFEVWDHRPSWKEIRKAMSKTFYYGSLPRVSKIKNFLRETDADE
jgi:hypothetical protein